MKDGEHYGYPRHHCYVLLYFETVAGVCVWVQVGEAGTGSGDPVTLGVWAMANDGKFWEDVV